MYVCCAKSANTVGRSRRFGAVLPLVVLTLIVLFGFLALAIDLGMIAVARSQAQNMADAAAMAGARTLNGQFVSATDDTKNNNYEQVDDNATAAARENKILGETLNTAAPSQSKVKLTIQIGSYTYYDSITLNGVTYTKQFVPRYPQKDPNSNWSLVRTTVEYTGEYAFGKIFKPDGGFTVRATSMAAHRPRDVAIIMDLSGSMRYDSLIGVDHSGTREGGNNPDDTIPTFGHYSSSSAGLRRTTPYSSSYALCNFTKAMPQNANRTPMINDYYQHVRTPNVPNDEVPAWTAAGNGDSTGWVSGDKPWKSNFNTGSSWAQRVRDITGGTSYNATWETNGYGTSFAGYTQGPGYWGKTFFIWPPDPRGVDTTVPGYNAVYNNGAKDWRKRFFLNAAGTAPLDDNTRLWDSSGNWRSPSVQGTDYYRINYAAIFYWIRNVGPSGNPNPFPNRLQAGRILYYDAIPDPTTDPDLNAKMWGTGGYSWPPADLNYRFWKDYIDYVLGVKQINASGSSKWDANVSAGATADLDGSGPRPAITLDTANNSPNIVAYTGYGDDFSWGTVAINAKPTGTGNVPYMNYNDNPKRPRLHFWFGPMTLVDFLGNHNLGNRYQKEQHYWFPGTTHESPAFPCKVGFQAALKDMEKNHPNDHVTLILFSHPKGSANDGQGRRFNRVVAPLGRDYQRMIDGLWFPPYTLDNPSANINIYDYNKNAELPRPIGGTCYAMPLMLAFNQFSINTSLRTFNPAPAPYGDAGGLGRKGAQKLIIFETDGDPNVKATKTATVSSTPHASYFPIRYNSSNPSASEYPTVSDELTANSSTVVDEIRNLCNELVADESDSSGLATSSKHGFGTKSKPVLIHCIAFGQLVGTTPPDTLVMMETIGNIPVEQRIGSTTAPYGTTAKPYKMITGTEDEMRDGLRNCIQRIMQSGVQVSLLE
ncbi:MAG TPA: pilus assembly protein TadG-related protein [Gemmataceae bacterium]|nr:pilus assembly protein TadG-related protein [Gemmataceae bacterium]